TCCSSWPCDGHSAWAAPWARNPFTLSSREGSFRMFPKPLPSLTPKTAAYESLPMVKPTGIRENDARWFFGKELNLMGVQAVGMGLG
ncbi:hypothetical protein, partial [Enterobacter hormaechei]|uniref:hypothetical protein n=1 Tax=Enterobacter hormaechei TaxID=158836 RepID=UPI0019543357